MSSNINKACHTVKTIIDHLAGSDFVGGVRKQDDRRIWSRHDDRCLTTDDRSANLDRRKQKRDSKLLGPYNRLSAR